MRFNSGFKGIYRLWSTRDVNKCCC